VFNYVYHNCLALGPSSPFNVDGDSYFESATCQARLSQSGGTVGILPTTNPSVCRGTVIRGKQVRPVPLALSLTTTTWKSRSATVTPLSLWCLLEAGQTAFMEQRKVAKALSNLVQALSSQAKPRQSADQSW